ncbi:OLC1v1018330C4 [Oldenlandia corymbosa var. corymbosa]|uniref:OLC1v1018330C4 n=1 Tax=Oldenlandia corymbosa var. corymbosa TaxID=529605 RepID=A0AAV1EBM8_OLDCO|nr:OLC1v1018330C4 [Oldenlandia corymbosa var. corymbosa]
MMMMMGKLSRLSHLFVTVFLYCFSSVMVVPAITDVTMAAICPGQDECSLAIYLSGIQHAIIGLGSLVIMPLVGNLSDKYGRKVMLTVPMTLHIFPLAILAYSRTTEYYYVYYVLRTMISMITEGSVQCLALAYVADNVAESQRVSVFGILSGIASCAFVCGNLTARFLPTSATFQFAAAGNVVALVYMRAFLPDSTIENVSTSTAKPDTVTETDSLLEKAPQKALKLFKRLPSFRDTASLLGTSHTFSQAAMITFFSTVAEVGAQSSLLYYLKAQFHFDKDQFADLMIISGISGTVSQLLLMPILAPLLGEMKLLSVGLFFSFVHVYSWFILIISLTTLMNFLYEFKRDLSDQKFVSSNSCCCTALLGHLGYLSPFFLVDLTKSTLVLLHKSDVFFNLQVPYAAALISIVAIFAMPCLRSIASKEIGPTEQGKAQGCLTGICSFAHVISPLAFSPLSAWFLSDSAPFRFPGFSIMVAAFAGMIAFGLSLMINKAEPMTCCSSADYPFSVEP